MLNQKDRFTNAMRHASNSNNPPGGSTAIQGNPGTIRNGERKVQFVRANMVRAADDSQASSSVNNDQASSSAAAPDPPWGQGPEQVQAQPTTGWTMPTWGDGSDNIAGPEPEPECWGHARSSSSDESPTFYVIFYRMHRVRTITEPYGIGKGGRSPAPGSDTNTIDWIK